MKVIGVETRRGARSIPRCSRFTSKPPASHRGEPGILNLELQLMELHHRPLRLLDLQSGHMGAQRQEEVRFRFIAPKEQMGFSPLTLLSFHVSPERRIPAVLRDFIWTSPGSPSSSELGNSGALAHRGSEL